LTRRVKHEVGRHIRDVAAYLLTAEPRDMVVILDQAVPEWLEMMDGLSEEAQPLLLEIQEEARSWITECMEVPFPGERVAEALLKADAALHGRLDAFKREVKQRKKYAKEGTMFGRPSKASREAGFRVKLPLPATPPMVRGVCITKLLTRPPPGEHQLQVSGAGHLDHGKHSDDVGGGRGGRGRGVFGRGRGGFWRGRGGFGGGFRGGFGAGGFHAPGSMVGFQGRPMPRIGNWQTAIVPFQGGRVGNAEAKLMGQLFGWYTRQCLSLGKDIAGHCPACLMRGKEASGNHSFRECNDADGNREFAVQNGFVLPPGGM
jgi:hypothetical protein